MTEDAKDLTQTETRWIRPASECKRYDSKEKPKRHGVQTHAVQSHANVQTMGWETSPVDRHLRTSSLF